MYILYLQSKSLQLEFINTISAIEQASAVYVEGKAIRYLSPGMS